MQEFAPLRRCALDDDADGPPMPSPVLPAPAAGSARCLVFLDRLGMIGLLAAG